MRNRCGVTEQFWSGLYEDKKLIWAIVLWGAAFIAGILVEKTGIRLIDVAIGGFTTIVSLLMIQGQRNLSKYKNKRLKKWIIRTVIGLSVSGAVLMGSAIFIWVICSFFQGWLKTFLSATSVKPLSQEEVVLGIIMVCGILVAAARRVFRGVDFEGLIYRAPRASLKWLLVDRPFVVSNFPEFAFFEITVLLVTYLYSSTAAHLVLLFIGGGSK